MNVKGIKVSENLSANPKPYQLSLPLPRGNLCRMFRKEVLKGEKAETQLNMASKNIININAERQFPVCTPATVCTPRESICFRTFTRNRFIAVTVYLTEQHTLFPFLKKRGVLLTLPPPEQSKSPRGSSGCRLIVLLKQK